MMFDHLSAMTVHAFTAAMGDLMLDELIKRLLMIAGSRSILEDRIPRQILPN